MDLPNVAIMFPWLSCFMLTCPGITHHEVRKHVCKKIIRRLEISKHD